MTCLLNILLLSKTTKIRGIWKQSHSPHLNDHLPHVASGEWVGQRWVSLITFMFSTSDPNKQRVYCWLWLGFRSSICSFLLWIQDCLSRPDSHLVMTVLSLKLMCVPRINKINIRSHVDSSCCSSMLLCIASVERDKMQIKHSVSCCKHSCK